MSILEVTIPELVVHIKSTAGPLLAVADVGATNTRFSLVTDYASNEPVKFVKGKAGSAAALKQLFCDIQDALGHETCARIAAGSIALPGPVEGGKSAVMANFEAQTLEERTVRTTDLPPELFPHARTTLLNDLEAAAYGIVGLSSAKRLETTFQVLWNANEKPKAKRAPLKTLPPANVLVVAPGTGLGSALLHYQSETRQYNVLGLEFGHTTVPPLDFPELLKAYTKKLGFDTEYDDVCAGRGLEFAYTHFAGAGAKPLSAAQISVAAKAGRDAAAVKAMHAYHDFVMAYISQCTMGFQNTLVVLAGDNTIHNQFYFDSVDNVNRMHKRLLAHSAERMQFMSRTAVAIQAVPTNLNITGCMYVAHLKALQARSKL